MQQPVEGRNAVREIKLNKFQIVCGSDHTVAARSALRDVLFFKTH